jgi:hypothetical protein
MVSRVGLLHIANRKQWADNKIVLLTVAQDQPVVFVERTGKVNADIDFATALVKAYNQEVRNRLKAQKARRLARKEKQV